MNNRGLTHKHQVSGASEGATGPREASASQAHPLVTVAWCSETTSPPRPTAGPSCPSDICLAHLLAPPPTPTALFQALCQGLPVGWQENKLALPVIFQRSHNLILSMADLIQCREHKTHPVSHNLIISMTKLIECR